jgi:hypothetical protein
MIWPEIPEDVVSPAAVADEKKVRNRQDRTTNKLLDDSVAVVSSFTNMRVRPLKPNEPGSSAVAFARQLLADKCRTMDLNSLGWWKNLAGEQVRIFLDDQKPNVVNAEKRVIERSSCDACLVLPPRKKASAAIDMPRFPLLPSIIKFTWSSLPSPSCHVEATVTEVVQHPLASKRIVYVRLENIRLVAGDILQYYYY